MIVCSYLKLYFLLIALNSIFCRKDCGNHPLILTSYLEAGKIDEAQEKALVTPDIMTDVRSYSGYFNVNKTCGNNLFFWFVRAENNWKTAPVLLWQDEQLTTSSLTSMFTGVGPFNYSIEQGLVKNEYRWTKDYSVIFLDQIAGVGFSFTEKECYPKEMSDIARELYSALEQFFTLFPDLQKNKFFLTGRWSVAQYLPALASEIDRKNHGADAKINLKGLLIGNPVADVRCIDREPYLYELGIVDEDTAKAITKEQAVLIKYINDKSYIKAYYYDGTGDANSGINLPNGYNILEDQYPTTSEFEIFIKNFKVRKQIHVGNSTFNTLNYKVYKNIIANLYEPHIGHIQDLLKSGKYTVGFFLGQLDSTKSYSAFTCLLNQLKWEGADEYRTAHRRAWYVSGRLAGWVKVAKNLFEVVVKGSGINVPREQGKTMLAILSAAVSDSPWSTAD